jgi:hypothetical protein
MIEFLTNFLDWKIHGPLSAAVVAIAYLGNKHVKADASRHAKMNERLADLETDRIVKADFNRLEDRMDEGFKELRSILLADKKA